MGGLWGDLVSVMRTVMLFLSHLTGSYGVGIILLTVIIRLILFPLYKTQLDSFKRMQTMQPELKRIQERYKDDKQRLAEEQMKLYREGGVNPMASCLPMVLQLPLIYALYDMLRGFDYSVGGLSPAFLWLPNLKAVDPLHIMPVLGGLSTYWQTKISMTMQPGTGQQQMQAMTYLMPVIMLYVFWKLPSGLAVYWIVANLMTIGQQYLTLGTLNKKNGPSGSSGLSRSGRPK